MEDLIKRQEELSKEFDALFQTRIQTLEKVKDMENKLNQLTGAYNEIARQIEESKKKGVKKEEIKK